MNCDQRGKITLNVGGQLFTTTIETLVSSSSYFSGLFNFNSSQEEPLFIDRSPKAFAEILEYIRSPQTYHVPKKYENELIYYGIPYDESNLEDNIDDIMTKHIKIVLDKIDILERQINYIRDFVSLKCDMSKYYMPKCDMPKCNLLRGQNCMLNYCTSHCKCLCIACDQS